MFVNGCVVSMQFGDGEDGSGAVVSVSEERLGSNRKKPA